MVEGDLDLSSDLDLQVDSDADGVDRHEEVRFHCPKQTQNREQVAKANLYINRSYIKKKQLSFTCTWENWALEFLILFYSETYSKHDIWPVSKYFNSNSQQICQFYVGHFGAIIPLPDTSQPPQPEFPSWCTCTGAIISQLRWRI